MLVLQHIDLPPWRTVRLPCRPGDSLFNSRWLGCRTTILQAEWWARKRAHQGTLGGQSAQASIALFSPNLRHDVRLASTDLCLLRAWPASLNMRVR